MFLNDDDIDINEYKTRLILNMYNFLVFYDADIEVFGDIINEIISITDLNELMNLDVCIVDDDNIMEKILIKNKINREVIVETHK
jgi:hypothetical protein